MSLVRNCQEFGDLLNARIFKQMSIFLRELSNDNEYAKGLSLETFAPIVENPELLACNAENLDFYMNLVEFHFNVIVEKEGQVGVFSRLDFYLAKIGQVLGPAGTESARATDPVTFFRDNFLEKYKLSDVFQQNAQRNLTISEDELKDNPDDDENEQLVVDEDEDQVAKDEP